MCVTFKYTYDYNGFFSCGSQSDGLTKSPYLYDPSSDNTQSYIQSVVDFKQQF